MKSALTILSIALAASVTSTASATTYQCETNDHQTTAEFQFKNGSPVEATMTYDNDFHESTMMLQFMEDYQEIPGKSLYVQVSMLMAGLIFNATYLPGSTSQMTGNLHVFAEGPMQTIPLTCTATP